MTPDQRAMFQDIVSRLDPNVRVNLIRSINISRDNPRAGEGAFQMLLRAMSVDPEEIEILLPHGQKVVFSDFLQVLREILGLDSQAPES